MTTPHKATPEQWRHTPVGIDAPPISETRGTIKALRDTLAALERREQALESGAATLADIANAYERSGQQVAALHAPAAAPASDDAWQEFLQELESLQHRALGEGIGPRCDMVEWARLLWSEPPAAAPAPTLRERALALLEPEGTPARVLNEVQLALIREALQEGADG